MFEIIFRTRFERIFKKLGRNDQKLIISELEKLAENPLTHPNVRHISNVAQRAYRIRIGRWRVLYFVLTKSKIIEVIDLFMKKSDADYKRRK
ncbi:MAG: type II toxin-antitoxin system RelE/ParE family toxin [bacterium]